MSQCCGKIPSQDDVKNIRDSIEKYHQQHSKNQEAHGSPQSGEVKNNRNGSVSKISPYNPGDVIQSETYNSDGSIHYTTINSSTGVRHSYDVDRDGNITNEHTTNQNLPVGHPDRHKD